MATKQNVLYDMEILTDIFLRSCRNVLYDNTNAAKLMSLYETNHISDITVW